MIGIYDTGKGGGHIYTLAQNSIPTREFIFFEDTEALPLGDKTHQEIQDRVVQVTQMLFEQGCSLVILACNTASVHSIRYLQDYVVPTLYPEKNVLGVTAPLIELTQRFFGQYQHQPGVLLATPATCRSGFYQTELRNRGFHNIRSIACQGLAEAIDQANSQSIRDSIESLPITSNDSYMILACTHYSVITSELNQCYPHCEIIDPSPYIVERLQWYLNTHPEYL